MPKTTLKHELTVHALTTKLWSVLTSSDFTRQFLFNDEFISEWTEGSPVISAETNEKHGTIRQVIPGVLLSFDLHLPELSRDPVEFRYELAPGEDGIQLKLVQELNLHNEVSVRSITENTNIMLQKIKWLAEYS